LRLTCHLALSAAQHSVCGSIDVRVATRSFGRLVEEVRDSGEAVMITTSQGSAAVLMSADDFDSLQETLFWLSQRGIRDSLALSENDIRTRLPFGEDKIRTKFGVPKRPC
jgi:prevent-host-death family protein